MAKTYEDCGGLKPLKTLTTPPKTAPKPAKKAPTKTGGKKK